jgi:hypothetical protein
LEGYVDIIRAWDAIKENIKMSAKERPLWIEAS